MGPILTKLERKLVEQVTRQGPMTFRDFMQSALYDPELGYYNTERLKIGPEGDYYTSSNLHAAFGAVLAGVFVELDAETPNAASAQTHTVIEVGAGTGELAFDVLSTMRDEYPTMFRRLTYIIVETSPAMRKRQRNRLSSFADRVRWCELHELEDSPIIGIAFSNEFVDSMPVHRARYNSGTIEELYVARAEPGETLQLALTWGKPSTRRLCEYVERMGVTPQQGQIIEINLDVIDWLARMALLLERGFMVTIDYGDNVEHLWSRYRGQGTLRSFYRHRLIDSPLERIGEQDMTASVNFTGLIEYGSDFGFELVSCERQTNFLARRGLIERIVAAHSAKDSLDDLKQRLSAKNLLIPGGISDSFHVLIQRKDWQ